jgi:hypothetical protein
MVMGEKGESRERCGGMRSYTPERCPSRLTSEREASGGLGAARGDAREPRVRGSVAW